MLLWRCPKRRKRPDCMKILVATDAWHPQVNGVVRTLSHVSREARALGVRTGISQPRPVLDSTDAELSGNSSGIGRLASVSRAGLSDPAGCDPRCDGRSARTCHAAGLPATRLAVHDQLSHPLSRLPCRSDCRYLSAGPAKRPGPGCAASTHRLPPRWRRRQRLLPNSPRAASKRQAVATRRRCRSVSPTWAGVSLNLPRPIFLTVGRLAVEKNLEVIPEARSAGYQAGRRRRPGATTGWRGSYRMRCFSDRIRVRRWPKSTLRPMSSCFQVVPTPSGSCCWRRSRAACPLPHFRRCATRRHRRCAALAYSTMICGCACLGALECSREECRDFALNMTWATSARIFLEHVTHAGTLRAQALGARCNPSAANIGAGASSLQVTRAPMTGDFARATLSSWERSTIPFYRPRPISRPHPNDLARRRGPDTVDQRAGA